MQAPATVQEADYSVGQGDLEPLLLQLTKSTGEPIDLSAALSVVFRGVHQTRRGTKFSGLAAIQPPDPNDLANPNQVPYIVQWSPVAGQTDIPGMYNVQCVVVWPGVGAGAPIPQTIPNIGYRQLWIQPAAA